MKETMRVRLWKNYMALKHYVWDGYTAPELTPDVQSNQVIALMQIVEELEKRVDAQHSEIEKLRNKVVILEGLEKGRQGDVYWRNR